MMVPVRCFTCGSLIGDKHEDFKKRVREGEKPAEVLDDVGVKRYCCRRTLLASVDLMDQILPYMEALARRRAEFASE